MKSLLYVLLTFALTGIARAVPALAWNPNPANENVTSYKVYEHVGSSFNLIATVAPPVTTYSLGGVNGQHLYAVSAVNVAGEGPRSADVTFPATPTSVTGLTITP